MTYDGIVFDMDGVILEPTEDLLIREAVEAAFREHGIDDPDANHVDAVRYGSALTIEELERLCQEQGLDADEFWRVREQYASEKQLETVRDGEKPLYDDSHILESLDQRLGLVSNNQQRTVEGILDYFEIDGLFDAVYGRPPTHDGIRYTKPDPYYLERIIAEFEMENLLFVGDSNVDIAAAEKAGLDSAFICRAHREGYELRTEPTYRIESLSDLRQIT
ncbi:HAD-IA family hydrolase [Halorubrum sp. CBA1125]|jgi:HAD superfamily hydrolase (TIGR01549 family)|uniref:HAD family hydrolase n=1 Tax=Halorubrum sp. CBA1125 TaxID=2668072 RepID=UPI0012E98B21|nr:HAD family hydrolase [Halorubrum sp. CBA1125]MUW14553.1 HAD-IA family hydrolase [Halorubrum sp. CBA1125]